MIIAIIAIDDYAITYQSMFSSGVSWVPKYQNLTEFYNNSNAPIWGNLGNELKNM
jgi:hypothetical protein